MHMALPLDHWLDQNAHYCNRFHARITPAGCAFNRAIEADLRCCGCGGLEDQQREPERHEPVIIQGEPEPDECMTRALVGALQEVLDGEEEEFPLDDALEELDEAANGELTSFHKELLALLDDDLEEPVPERKPEKKGPRRFEVFMGRCPRCSGYML